MDYLIGQILNNRYQILEAIGRGGMAYVFKAKDLKLNRFVAVKILRPEYTDNEQFIKKFDRESQAAAGLSHPNIVSVYDVGVQDNIYYIIMEFVDGITLKQYLNKKGHLDYQEATQYVLEVAEALKCAHEHKIIHRDIKPHNILLTRKLTPKVADFGIARAITSSTLTITNQTMGSVHYISPEQARGGFVDERSDLYSLGIMYYELLTGQVPFDEENTVSIAIKHIQEPIVPPKEIVPEIPDSVNEVIIKLTQKAPDARYQNTDELIADLDTILNDFTASLPSTALPPMDSDYFDGESLFQTEPLHEDDTDSDTDSLAKTMPKKKKHTGLWTSLIILLILGGAFIYIYLNGNVFNRSVVVPNLENMNVSDATNKLKELNLSLEVEKEEYSEDVETGKIISQDPKANSEAKEGTIIKVVVSKGIKTAEVPDVVGDSEEQATKTLTDANFTIDIKREFNSDYNYGTVFRMEPSSGSTVQEGTKVTIYVSKGEDKVNVPGIVGLTQADAQQRLSSYGLNIGTVTQQESSTYAAGMVISQDPAENTSVAKGTYINFVVSSGPPTKPDSSTSSNNAQNSGDAQNQNQNQNQTNSTSPQPSQDTPQTARTGMLTSDEISSRLQELKNFFNDPQSPIQTRLK